MAGIEQTRVLLVKNIHHVLRTVDGYAEGEEKGHPVATGTGALGASAAGAAVGSVAGPVGTLIGGAIGAVAGSAAGHEVGEAVNPTMLKMPTKNSHPVASGSGALGWRRSRCSRWFSSRSCWYLSGWRDWRCSRWCSRS
ncbi:MAG: hypothetical protein U1E91_01980 [Moraxella sp.]